MQLVKCEAPGRANDLTPNGIIEDQAVIFTEGQRTMRAIHEQLHHGEFRLWSIAGDAVGGTFMPKNVWTGTVTDFDLQL